jgi:hypothetical protein
MPLRQEKQLSAKGIIARVTTMLLSRPDSSDGRCLLAACASRDLEPLADAIAHIVTDGQNDVVVFKYLKKEQALFVLYWFNSRALIEDILEQHGVVGHEMVRTDPDRFNAQGRQSQQLHLDRRQEMQARRSVSRLAGERGSSADP